MQLKADKLIFKSANSHIYLEDNEQMGRQEGVKVLNAEQQSSEHVAQFLNEYELTKHLKIEGVRNAYGKSKWKTHDALILEYIDGETLEDYVEIKTPRLADLLAVLVTLTKVVGELHQHGVIHKDLNP